MSLENNKSDSSADVNENQPDSGVDANINKAIFDSQLNQKDRFANLLFLLGSDFAIQATNEVDQSLLLKQKENLTIQEENAFTYDITKKLALANWIFLTAGTIFLDTSYQRLKDKESIIPEDPSESDLQSLSGREMITLGNLLKVIGYTLAANGFELIADSTQKESES